MFSYIHAHADGHARVVKSWLFNIIDELGRYISFNLFF